MRIGSLAVTLTQGPRNIFLLRVRSSGKTTLGVQWHTMQNLGHVIMLEFVPRHTALDVQLCRVVEVDDFFDTTSAFWRYF